MGAGEMSEQCITLLAGTRGGVRMITLGVLHYLVELRSSQASRETRFRGIDLPML